MTFCVEGTWLCVPLEQMDSIAQPERLSPVPLAEPKHVGLLDRGDSLIPVMTLSPDDRTAVSASLVAVLRVRGEPVGLCIDRAGRVEDRYWFEESSAEPPVFIAALQPRRLMTSSQPHWCIDADRLWNDDAPAHTREPIAGTSPGQTTVTD